MLIPRLLEMGTGSVPGTAGHSAAQAQLPRRLRPRRPSPRGDAYVAWPPKGFVPYQTVYPRWSFTLRGGDFTNATVTMTRPGNVSVPATIIDRSTFAGPGIVWVANNLADGASWPKPTSDDPITVTVGNVIVGGTPQSFTYTTTIFDPADPDPAHTPLTITGPNNPTRQPGQRLLGEHDPERHRLPVALDAAVAVHPPGRRRVRARQLRQHVARLREPEHGLRRQRHALVPVDHRSTAAASSRTRRP